jgi:putative transposase
MTGATAARDWWSKPSSSPSKCRSRARACCARTGTSFPPIPKRADYLHQVSARLVSEHNLIAIENLCLGFMNCSRHLSRSSHDAEFGLFRQMLEYKAESAGIPVIAVNPSNTTQACSGCGGMVPKDLSVRVHACPDCGLVLDRDVNAARNILMLAIQTPLGASGQLVTWAVTPCVG